MRLNDLPWYERIGCLPKKLLLLLLLLTRSDLLGVGY